MLDIRTEELFPLRDVPKRIPKRAGRRLHIATVYRWAQHGLGGTRLETLRVGGTRYTSLAALQRFFDNLSALDPSSQPPIAAVRALGRRDTVHVLKHAGLPT